MNAADGATLRSSYDDAADAAGAPATVSTVTAVTVPAAPTVTGTITAPPSIEPGTDLLVTVSDADLNADPGLAETVAVTVLNEVTGETETLILTETGPDTGVFEATLPTIESASAGVSGNGTMTVADGVTLRASYDDAADAAGAPATVSDVTTVAAPATGGTGIQISGQVIIDNGEVGGTAHDATLNGGESGQGARTVQLFDAIGALIDTARTDLTGSYSFDIANTYADTNLTLVFDDIAQTERLIASRSSVFADPGSTDGSITFQPAADTAYNSFNFGLIDEPRLISDRDAVVQAGATITIAHSYFATTSGDVSFALSNLSEPVPGTVTQDIWRDVDCNQIRDGADAPSTASVQASANEQICLLVATTISSSVAGGASVTYDIVAATVFANTSAVSNLSNSDRITVTENSAITVSKQVCNTSLTLCDPVDGTGFTTFNQGSGGDQLTYRIGYSNTGATPINALTLADLTPAYTSLVDTPANQVASPAGFDCVFSTTGTGPGYTGGILWTCSGTLLPAAEGVIAFAVSINN